MAGWWLLHFWVCLLWLGHLAFGTDPRMIMIIFLKLFFMENDGLADHDDVLFLYFEVQIKTLPLFGRNCSFRVNNDHWNHVNYNFWYVQLIQSVRECRERLSTSITASNIVCSAVQCVATSWSIEVPVPANVCMLDTWHNWYKTLVVCIVRGNLSSSAPYLSSVCFLIRKISFFLLCIICCAMSGIEKIRGIKLGDGNQTELFVYFRRNPQPKWCEVSQINGLLNKPLMDDFAKIYSKRI